MGLLGGRRCYRRQADRPLYRPEQGPAAQSYRALLPGRGADQHGALPAGASGHHRSRRLAIRSRTGGAHRRCRVLGRAGAGAGQEGLCRSEGPHGEIRARARRTRHIARHDADRRPHAGRGARETRQAAKLADPDQCRGARRQPHRLRCVGPSARRSGAASARLVRGRPHLHERALRARQARKHDAARPLQPDRGGARPLGRVRHAGDDRRHARRMVRRGRRRRLQRPAAVFPRRVRRFRRSGRAGTAAAAACSAGTTKARPCATISA